MMCFFLSLFIKPLQSYNVSSNMTKKYDKKYEKVTKEQSITAFLYPKSHLKHTHPVCAHNNQPQLQKQTYYKIKQQKELHLPQFLLPIKFLFIYNLNLSTLPPLAGSST